MKGVVISTVKSMTYTNYLDIFISLLYKTYIALKGYYEKQKREVEFLFINIALPASGRVNRDRRFYA